MWLGKHLLEINGGGGWVSELKVMGGVGRSSEKCKVRLREGCSASKAFVSK